MNYDTPQELIILLNEKLKENYKKLTYRFDLYFYEPKKTDSEREIILVSSEHLTKDWLENIIAVAKKENKEVAFVSEIIADGNKLHLPVIDFATEEINKAVQTQVIFPDNNVYYYKSGRSFHAYFDKLVNQEEWYKFMGKTLLFNDGERIVDERWVGHRVIGGFGALRITFHTKQYLQEPQIAKAFKHEKQYKLKIKG